MPNTVDAVLQAAGQNPAEASEEEKSHVAGLLESAVQNPPTVVVSLLRAKRNCARAAEAAGELEQMLKKLLSGNKQFCRLEMVRDTPEGPRAITRLSGQLCELPIHPDVDIEQLRTLAPWEYAAVNEQVIVGAWRDDRYLFAVAQGEVVDFKGYKDRDLHLALVAQHGRDEKVVALAPSLHDTELVPPARLVLQRDNPHLAISSVPVANVQSRFEVPPDKIHTRLEDLAGVEEIAERLLEDILLRVYFGEIRDEFCLDALRGILLYSKPGMGKTAFISAIALWLHEHADDFGFDLILYVVKPNETKSMWHGEDARIMREDLWAAIRARQAMPRTRPLIQLVVFDELDSLGKRAGAGEHMYSAAQSDSLEALLVEMDGMIKEEVYKCPSYVLCAGMTNRPDRVDEAAKRPGRFDLILPMPEIDAEGAEDVMAIYARGESLPWCLDGETRCGVDEADIRTAILRPAIARIFPAVVLRYKTDTQRSVDLTAGQLMANVHYKDAMSRAKKRAAGRKLRKLGTPAVTFDDVMDCLVDVAVEMSQQMAADPQMLIRQQEIKVPVAAVDVVPKEELEQHRYVQLHSA